MFFLKLLRVFYRTSIQTDMEYRADFFTRIFASLLGLLTTAGSLWVAYQYAPEIKGWSFAEALVLLSIYYLMDGLIETFIAPNMREIMNQVREGTLDFVLMKPVSSQFMATFRTLNIWRASNLLIGGALAVYCVQRLALSVGWAQAGTFAVTLAAGLAVIYSFWLVLVTLTFWVVRLENIEQIIWQAFETGRYPVEIYPHWLRMALTYVVPVVFIITVPAEALTGRLAPDFVPVALGAAAAALLASSAFWRFGLRYYTGASA
ncbi:MAG: ABC transporter permease [Armatimonadota bacterium]